jgi:hypothetical protein
MNLEITLVHFDPLLPDPHDLAHARGLSTRARRGVTLDRYALLLSIAVLAVFAFDPGACLIAAMLALIRARVTRRTSRLRTRARKLQLGHASSVTRKRT